MPTKVFPLSVVLFTVQQALERQKVARENRVVMYRKYRTGDLPDIQIKYSELIAPLQAVAQVSFDSSNTLENRNQCVFTNQSYRTVIKS